MICGLIILRYLALHLKLRLLTKTSSITSVIAFASHFFSFLTDPSGVLSEPLEYKEIAHVCSTFKLGVSGVEIDYEHIRFAGPPFWKLLFQLYQTFLNNFSVCDSLLPGVILPLFKGKGAEDNNKDNYRGITLFPALCKIYEMVLLNQVGKILRNSRDSFQIWNSVSDKGLGVLKPLLLFWNS